MKGLMLKEYYLIKRNSKMYALYVLIFGGAAIFTASIAMFGVMAVITISTIPLSNFSVDEYCKWDKMAVSSPVSRNQIVGAKYLLVLACVGVSILISILTSALGSLVRSDAMSFGDGMVSLIASIGVMTIMMMVLLPVIVKVGVEKGRIAMMLVFGGTFGAILLAAMLAERMELVGAAPDELKLAISFSVLLILPLTAMLATFISYKISCAIYAKKEL